MKFVNVLGCVRVFVRCSVTKTPIYKKQERMLAQAPFKAEKGKNKGCAFLPSAYFNTPPEYRIFLWWLVECI